MDINKIVQLRLLKKDFNKLVCDDIYSVLFVDKENYLGYVDKLLEVSSLMHLDFEWDGIPTEEILHNRFEHDSHCLFWNLNNKPIGWAWSNYAVTPTWEESIQTLNEMSNDCIYQYSDDWNRVSSILSYKMVLSNLTLLSKNYGREH